MKQPITSPQTEILFAIQRQLRDTGYDALKHIEYDLYSWDSLIFDFNPGRIPLLKKRELNGRVAIPVVSMEQVMSLIEEKVKITQTK